MNLGALFGRVLSGAAAAGAVLASAGVTVVAASYALYALLKTWLPAAGAAACVALAFAVIAAVVAVVAASLAKGKPSPKRAKAPEPPASLADRALTLARERPLMAAGMAVAAGVLALRNPVIVTGLLSTLAQPRRPRT